MSLSIRIVDDEPDVAELFRVILSDIDALKVAAARDVAADGLRA